MWFLSSSGTSLYTDLIPGFPCPIPQKFHLVPSVNAVSGSQELQWMVQPHFLGPSSYPRPLAYPPYSSPQPRPGVIRALGPPPGVRRRPCEQVRSRGIALVQMPTGVLRGRGQVLGRKDTGLERGRWGGKAIGDSWSRQKVIGAPGVIQRAKRSILDQGKLSGA